MPQPTIIQNKTVHRVSTTPLPLFTGSGATGQIAWSSPWGSFSRTVTNNGQPTEYTPNNQTDVVSITAKDLSDNAVRTVLLEIQATFPYQGNYRNVPRSVDQNTLSSIAEDGGESFTEKGDLEASFIWKFLMRQQNEWSAVDAFFSWHKRSKSFWLLDIARQDMGNLTSGKLVRVRFADAFSDDPAGADFIDYNCSFKQAVRP